jgi:enediyne biosynthesis protein E4
VAPVNGIVVTDIDADGNLDIAMVGNDYGNEVFAGRYDAFSGLILRGDGAGQFYGSPAVRSGFKVDGDAKSLGKLRSVSGEEFLIATQNLDSLRIFKANREFKPGRFFQPTYLENSAELYHENGKKEKVEFYHGSGYLAQSTRTVSVPETVSKIVVFDSKGGQRSIAYDQLAFAHQVK